jgi:hypothetical protein
MEFLKVAAKNRELLAFVMDNYFDYVIGRVTWIHVDAICLGLTILNPRSEYSLILLLLCSLQIVSLFKQIACFTNCYVRYLMLLFIITIQVWKCLNPR